MASLPDADELLGASYWAQFPASASPSWAVTAGSTPAATIAVPQQVEWHIGPPSRKTLIVAGAVLVLLIGGITVYQVFKPEPPSPESAVRKYFSDLASGDTAGALKLADSSESSLTSSNPLLTARALAQPADRPSGLTVVSTEKSYGGDSADIKVTYRLGGTTVSQTISVFKSPSSDAGYLLHDPFISLRVPAQDSRTVQINGIDLSADNQNLTAFPGLYHASLTGSTLLQPETADAKITDTGNSLYGASEPEFSVDFAAPTLAPRAQAAVDAQVKEQVDACAAVTTASANTNDCPFSGYDLYLSGTVTSIQWTVTAYPQVTLTVASYPSATDQVDLGDANQDGSVHYVAQYTDYSGATQTATGDKSFAFNGTAAVRDGKVQVIAR